ncbi:Amino acid ABC transporter substrate-binding protein [Paraburkholderia unamae]|uniref:ABC transporter substrate-binding protein n=1 Tax=Paraburkholderia unamae TaxID=219649 RepID=UPI001CB33C75|nr:ABC transporter substrate-binding protein [Paraburkholderia unamae]CAG9243384.1 Amino acid ABC transporter substrate-binding protein [Paraburkholderia unamae]
MKPTRRLGPLLAATFAAGSMAMAAAPAHADASYGDCLITGAKGTDTIKPAVPGQLTVEINLPAVGDFNGDTPDTIKDGFEFCMAANMAHRLGLDKLKLVNVTFDSIVAGQTRDYDIALAQISVTEPRKKVVDFSVPYQQSDFGVASRKKDPVTEQSIKSSRIGVQAGTTLVQFVPEKIKATNVQVFPDTSSMFTALVAGKVDAVLTDTTIVLGQVANAHGKLEIVGQYVSGQETAGVYPKGSPNRATIDKVMTDLKNDGTLKKLEATYLVPQWGRSPASVAFWKP